MSILGAPSIGTPRALSEGMLRSYATINLLSRGDRIVFEAIWRPSYAHKAHRSAYCLGRFPTEAAAIAACERVATHERSTLTIIAGDQPRGVRRRGSTITRAEVVSGTVWS
jgi:hypothetical protein